MGFAVVDGLLLDHAVLGVGQSSVCQGPDVPQKRPAAVSMVGRFVDLAVDPAEGFAVFYDNKDGPLARLEVEQSPVVEEKEGRWMRFPVDSGALHCALLKPVWP